MNARDDLRRRQNMDFKKVVRTVMAVQSFITHRRSAKDHQKDVENDANVRRVFELELPPDMDDGTDPKSRILKAIFFTLEETGIFFYMWTSFVALGCVYNLVTIVVTVFEQLYQSHFNLWISCNLIFDLIFMLDLFIMCRLEVIVEGICITSSYELFLRRLRSIEFYLDLLCVFPTDLVLFLRRNLTVLRLNRLLKCYRLQDFSTLTEMRTSFPNMFRLFKLIFTCFVIFHWNGCLYFFISMIHGFEDAVQDDWVFSYHKIPDPIFTLCGEFNESDGCTHPDGTSTFIMDLLDADDDDYYDFDNITDDFHHHMNSWGTGLVPVRFSNFTKQYSLSFYWSALTLTTLGEQPWPNTTWQCAFEIVDTLLGLVIFAVIVGDVGNMVSTMNRKKTDFEEQQDGSKGYMISRKVAHLLQNKVSSYYNYVWKEGKTNVDEKEISDFMPPRLYGQLAVHIHMETLRRVKLFEDCEPNLLYEIILRLELQVYSAGDYICKKGEVGKEMYIVKSGFVEVVNEDGTKVFVRLGEGTVFGELSILNIPGNKNGNRRTANVRSVGFCDLYTLQKDDLWAVLLEYPHAKDSLLAKGRALLAKDNMLEEVIDNPLDLEADLPLEDILMRVKRAVQQLDDATSAFHERSAIRKRRLALLEKEFAELSGEMQQENCSSCSLQSFPTV